MSFEEFQNFARLYVVGGLDEEEMAAFQSIRGFYGEEAEDFLRECRQLNSAFALSLRPEPPREDARERLMALIQKSAAEGNLQANRS